MNRIHRAIGRNGNTLLRPRVGGGVDRGQRRGERQFFSTGISVNGRCRSVSLMGLFLGMLALSTSIEAQESAVQEIPATACFVRTYEEAKVPALERGLITEIKVNEGDLISAGSELSVLEDDEARIRVAMAKVDLELATERLEGSYTLKIAEAKVVETRQLIEKSRIEQQIAQQASDSNVAVRQARISLNTSQADVDRALSARKAFEGSVSDAELSRLVYLRDKSQLEIESAEEAKLISQLEVGVEQASVATAQAMLERLKLEQSQAGTDYESEKLEYNRLKLQLELAETQLARRKIIAPFDGMVVEQLHHRGEWLEPGQPLFRVVRLDRLIVEGYANAAQVHHSLRGAKVRVVDASGNLKNAVTGTLLFVSPEIDPVTQQVQVRAIIDNMDGRFRSGQSVEMSILVNPKK